MNQMREVEVALAGEEHFVTAVIDDSPSFERIRQFVTNLPPPHARYRVQREQFVPTDFDEFLKAFCPWGKRHSVFQKKPTKWGVAPFSEGVWVNSVFENPLWRLSYFHWHRNFLTRLAFLVSQGFSGLHVIVEDSLPEYKIQSLEAMGIPQSNLVPFSKVRGKYLESFVSVEGIDRHKQEAIFDFVRPNFLNIVAKNVKDYFGVSSPSQGNSIFVSRGHGDGRKLLNEDFVIEYLRKRGYESVQVGNLSYEKQVRSLSAAGRVIGVHGGALTNVMFSEYPEVLELAPIGHGLRPDFIPFALSAGGHIATVGIRSENRANDLFVPERVLSWWIEQNGLKGNFFKLAEKVD